MSDNSATSAGSPNRDHLDSEHINEPIAEDADPRGQRDMSDSAHSSGHTMAPESTCPTATGSSGGTQPFEESGEGYLSFPGEIQEKSDATRQYLMRHVIGKPVEPHAAAAVVSNRTNSEQRTRRTRGSPLPDRMYCVVCRRDLAYTARSYRDHLATTKHVQNLERYLANRASGRLEELEHNKYYISTKDLGEPVRPNQPYVRWLS